MKYWRSRPRRLVAFGVVLFLLILLCLPSHEFLEGHHGAQTATALDFVEHWEVVDGLFSSHQSKQTHVDALVSPYDLFPDNLFILLRSTVGWDKQAPWVGLVFVMKIFAALSFILAVLILERLLKDALIGFLVAACSFSGYYFLYYYDMASYDLPGLTLWLAVVYGVIRYEQGESGRWFFWVTIVSSVIAWSALVVAVFYWAICLVRDPRSYSMDFSSPILRAVLCAVVIIMSQIALDYGLKGDDLGGVVSELNTRVKEDDSRLQSTVDVWVNEFLPQQMYRLGRSSLPWVIQAHFADQQRWLTGFGMLVLLSLLLLLCSRAGDRLLWCFLSFSGLVWIFPFWKYAAYHEFQAVWYLGATMGFYGLLIGHFRGVIRHFPFVSVVSVVALVCLSLIDTHAQKEGSIQEREIVAFLDRIRKEQGHIDPEARVYVDLASFGLVENPLIANGVLPNQVFTPDPLLADYVISYKTR